MATTLFLSSLDSERLETVRACQFIRPVFLGPGKPGMLVRLTPGVIGQDFGMDEDLTEFVLTTRFEGADIRSRFTNSLAFVFIALPRSTWNTNNDRVDAADLEVVGWGELYRTAADAKERRFG